MFRAPLASTLGIDTIENVLLYHVVPGATVTYRQALKSNGAVLNTALPGSHRQGQGRLVLPRVVEGQRSRRQQSVRREGQSEQGQPADRARHQPGAPPGRSLARGSRIDAARAPDSFAPEVPRWRKAAQHPTEVLLEQSRTVLEWLERLPEDAFTQPTVLPEWNVAELAGHLIFAHRGLLAALGRPTRQPPLPVAGLRPGLPSQRRRDLGGQPAGGRDGSRVRPWSGSSRGRGRLRHGLRGPRSAGRGARSARPDHHDGSAATPGSSSWSCTATT